MSSSPPKTISTTDPNAASTLVLFHGAQLGYRGRAVLRDVDLEVQSGEFWCFLGPNGEGKTTLIKAMIGGLRAQRGFVLRDRTIFGRGHVSYVPQELDLNPVLPTSVREFVTSGLAGIPVRGIDETRRLQRVLELVGLDASRRQNFWTLSGGQRRRALVARALIRDPKLLICDEPTAGLDYAAADAVSRILRDLNEQYRMTVVFVTHDIQLAVDHATHLAFFRKGRVIAGPVQSVLDEATLSATFGMPISVDRLERNRYRIGHHTGDGTAAAPSASISGVSAWPSRAS